MLSLLVRAFLTAARWVDDAFAHFDNDTEEIS